MGNAFDCIAPTNQKETSRSRGRPSPTATPFSTRPFFSGPSLFSSSSSRNKNTKNNKGLSLSSDGGHDSSSSIIQEQAVAAAFLFRHHQRNGSLPNFIRSTSAVHPSPGNSKKQGCLPKSLSARRRSLSDLTITPQLVNSHDQEQKIGSVESKHFVLVHGGGFGAWCWYKTMTLLEEAGFKVDVVDLIGSGVSSFDTNNSITSLAHYVKPLTHIFDKLEDGNKVNFLFQN
ncbi:putative methylesterase 11 [Hibiscus syriacus]|uniref:Methylesterase 11 n=1 Tax=Hibiscus syriacus TaxID=106335 RepID=A0A6A2X001_HIBSY|nr:putative methylesterase 11 [Hibiscus syriacus]